MGHTNQTLCALFRFCFRERLEMDANELDRLSRTISSLGGNECTFRYRNESLKCQKRRFDMGTVKSFYERNLLQHVFRSLPHNLQTLWVIRPKPDDNDGDAVVEDEENNQNAANYHDERGCPAAAPWMGEKREKIRVDETQRRPGATKSHDDLMRLCNELVAKRDKLLTSQSAVMMEARDANDQLQAYWVLYATMANDDMQYMLNYSHMYTFKENWTTGYQVHEPSLGSIACFKRNLNYYEEIDDKMLAIRSTYHPKVDEYCQTSVDFKWTENMDEIDSFLTKPNMTTSTAKVSIELNPSKCVSNPTLFAIGLQINALHVYYNMITQENYEMPLRTESCASVEKLALNIMERGTTKDFTETVWEECYKLPLEQLTATLQLVIKYITDFAERLTVDEANMSSLAMRVLAIKRGKRAQVVRRLGDIEAVEMLVECGELYVDNILLDVAPDSSEISDLVNGQHQSNDLESQLNMLNDRYSLVLIGDTIRELDMSVAKTKSIYEGYLFSKKNGQQIINVAFNVDASDAWHIATKVQPSLWEISYKNYKFTLSDALVGDNVRVGKSTADGMGKPNYFAVEKTTTSL